MARMAEAMAEEFSSAASGSPDAQANKQDANGNEHGEDNGQFVSKDGGASVDPSESGEGTKEHRSASAEEVSKFLKELPRKITPEEFDAILTTGFTDTDGSRNAVKYGTLLRDHLGADNHSVNDINARKSRLGIAVKMVREAKPMSSNDPNKPKENVYFGLVDGKAYIAVADEHNEIGAKEMVSYRRDSRRDERKRA